MVAGHSYGELPALCFAGAIDPDDLVGLSKERACAIVDAAGENKGKLIAVILTEDELKPLLENETELWAVNYNSPKQIVLGGTDRSIKSFIEKAAAQNILYAEIDVDFAFHSPLVSGAEDAYENSLKKIIFKTPLIKA